MEQTRFVRMHSWYRNTTGDRSFAVVEKWNRGIGNAFRCVQVSLLEYLVPEPKLMSVEDFWQLVDDGKLVEVIPGEAKKNTSA